MMVTGTLPVFHRKESAINCSVSFRFGFVRGKSALSCNSNCPPNWSDYSCFAEETRLLGGENNITDNNLTMIFQSFGFQRAPVVLHRNTMGSISLLFVQLIVVGDDEPTICVKIS